MPQNRVVLGVDIGSTKITTVAGEVDASRGVVLRGINVQPTDAVDRGVIRDLNQATKDIDASYSSAMYSSGLVADHVYIGLTGVKLRSLTNKAVINVPSAEGEVSQDDIENVFEKARQIPLQTGEQVVHSFVPEFVLDGQRTSQWPVGMIGHRLEAEAHIVAGAQSQIVNIERTIGKVGLRVQSYVYSLIAASEAVLSDEDRNAGCVLVDVGGRTTNVGVFHGGTLRFSRCIPMGGANYDQDLKQGLGVSFEEAQRIKKSYGKAWLDLDLEELDELVAVKFYGRREFDKIKRRRIYEVMQERTDELLEHIIHALNDSGLMQRVAGGIVLVGGGGQLRQLKLFLQKHLHRVVRLGMPTGIWGIPDEYRTPVYAAPLGLLLYAARYDRSAPVVKTNFVGEFVEALGDIIQGLFPKKKPPKAAS